MVRERLLLKNCRTLESDTAGAVTDLLLEGGIISRMGDIIPGDEAVLDAKGLLAMPGLIDCHVHLVLDGSPDIVSYAESGSADLFHAKALMGAGKSLEAGFTHLRDMGCFGFSVAGRQRLFEIGISAAGHMLTAPGGHVRSICRAVQSLPDAPAAVREQLAGGADFIKAIASGGLLTPGTTPLACEMPRELLKSISDSARECGRHLAVHAYGPREVGEAVSMGARSIEHGYWASPETMKTAAGMGTFFVPTLKALRSVLDNRDQMPPHAVRNADESLSASERMIRHAVKEGVRLAMGTDSGTPFNFHGDNAAELMLMHEAGLPPQDCIASATMSAACLLGLENRIGRVAQGFAADIILVSGDPLAQPDALMRKPAAVIKSGRVASTSLPLH